MNNPRALLASLHTAAVKGAAPFERTRDAVATWLHDHAVASTSRAHIIALGKASAAMASGAFAALDRAGFDAPHGVIVAAHDPKHEPPRTMTGIPVDVPPTMTVRIGDHPVPGPGSLDAADAIDEAIQDIEPGDVVLVLISGGTTALAAAPVAALSQMLGDTRFAQERIANLADTLLESGLAIHEMNAIRRRVLRWGAGRLALAIANRGVEHIPVFAISDVIGDDPSVIGSGPCTPDPLDENHFLALLDAHDVRGSLEPDMSRFFGLIGTTRAPAVPTADHPAFARVSYTLVARNHDAVMALADAARHAGIEHVIVDETPLEGEAAELGDRIARQALSAARALPAGTRALYVMGGEPVVHLRATYEQAWADAEERDRAREIDDMLDEQGTSPELLPFSLEQLFDAASKGAVRASDDDEPMSGGRMQVLALAAALVLEDAVFSRDPSAWRVHILAAGTDGRDGPTDATGAIVDASVPSLARKQRRKPERDLATGRSWFSLDSSEALLRTGPTGTNVMDVVGVLVDRA